MEFLQSLLEASSFPIFTAFLLGLMTAISPCPLATNITATAFIAREITNKKYVFLSGLVYTLGRAISYTLIGVVLFFGASTFQIAYIFQKYGERFLGPLLLIFGIFMLDYIRISIPGLRGNMVNNLLERIKINNLWSALFIGILFALAFCPYSGVLYFGMLIPMTIASPDGLILPFVFAIATGLPVILVAYLLAYSVSGISNFYKKIKMFEKWFRRVVAIVFIVVGLYYIFDFYIKPYFIS
jgi:cytochrome c-type biogenesis protein